MWMWEREALLGLDDISQGTGEEVMGAKVRKTLLERRG